MDKKQMPISELPFNFDGLEPQYGQIKHAELICPGVYFIMTKFNTDRPRFAGEYLVVTEDSPAISPDGTSPPRFRPFQGCSYSGTCGPNRRWQRSGNLRLPFLYLSGELLSAL